MDVENEERTAGTPAPPTQPLISGSQIHKVYEVGRDRVEILHDISLRVHGREMVAVMGPSGSGKSTLLYCLAGLEEVTGGQVVINGGVNLAGRSRTDLAKMRRSELGFMFQSYNLVPTLTAARTSNSPISSAAGSRRPVWSPRHWPRSA